MQVHPFIYGHIDAQKWSLVSANKTPKLNFARPWAKLNFRLLIKSCCNASSLQHAQATPKHSISNWISWSKSAHPFYLNLHGAFGLLLVLGGWEIERFIEHHLPIPCSRLRPEVFKSFQKIKTSSSNDTLIRSKVFVSSPRPFVRLLSPTSKGFLVELKVGRKTKAYSSQIFCKVKDRTQREVHVCGYVVDRVESERIRMFHDFVSPFLYFGHG